MMAGGARPGRQRGAAGGRDRRRNPRLRTRSSLEALSNVARHALASSVETTLTATGSELILTVVDDGVGIQEGGRRSGLANLAERARSCGGEFTAVTGESGGTQLCWRAPLKQP
jgi:signal transduction histidine kinase